MNTSRKSEQGFTLVELLIVVIILTIISAIAIPQFGSSTEDAKVSSLETNLSELRAAVELYYHQHNSRYPGVYVEADGTTPAATAAEAQAAFIAQLTQYTDRNGKVAGVKDATFKYGPYIKKATLPKNPFLDGAAAVDVLADIVENDITAAITVNGTSGWKFYTQTGRLVANDNTTLSDGTNTKDM
ncbi:MAG: prepilin-type N-terminal cleavage/methylation domain-containing protein [Nitrospirota bacterium]|jgi:prepilin-type N-terminal cleavage/methylation domain-containing protein